MSSFQFYHFRRLYFFVTVFLIVVSVSELALRHKNQKQELQRSKDHGLLEVYGSKQKFRAVIDDYANYELLYEPYLRWRGRPNQKNSVMRTNSFGLRTGEFSVVKPDNTMRIILTGNSVAWGYGATSDSQILSAHLARILNGMMNKAGTKNIEVINMAEMGYVSMQEYILWNSIVPLRPDLVIHLTGHNDALVVYNQRPIRLVHRAIPESILQLGKWPAFPALMSFYLQEILSRSTIWQKISKQFAQRTSVQRPIIPSLINNDFVSIMGLIAQRAEEENIPLINILQPTIYTTKKPLSTGEKNILAYYEQIDSKFKQFLTKQFASYGQGLTKLTTKNAFSYIDGSSFFSRYSGQIFIDPTHLSDTGYALMANEIAPFIIRRLSIRK